MMSDDERRLDDEFGPDAALARDLLRLGPLLRRREQTDAEEPAPAFLAALEARLMTVDVAAPHPPPVAVDDAQPRSSEPLRAPTPLPRRRPRALAWGGLTAAALIAGALALVVVLLIARGARRAPAPPVIVAFAIPFPSLADLMRGYPKALGGGGIVTPTLSLVDLAPGTPYAGRLRLSVPPLPNGPMTARAYLLAPPTFDSAHVGALAARLGIRAPVTHVGGGGATWAVAATGGLPSSQPLHSVAVALATGELIYHDTSYAPPTRLPSALAPERAASIARAWLTRLGWPTARMPLQSVAMALAAPPGVQAVNLGWAGAGPAALSAATLWVASDGRIVEARLWPPVERSRVIPARGVASAAGDVQRGHLPVAVEGVPPLATTAGTGTVQRVTIVQALSVGPDRRLYLVPTYRFAGTVQLQGVPGSHAWYGLAPAARR